MTNRSPLSLLQISLRQIGALLIGVLLFGVLALGVLACGGKKSTTPGDGPGDGTTQTDEERAATLGVIHGIVEAQIPNGLNPPAGANAAIAAALDAMPELAEAEEVPGGVWARFHDNEELFIFNSRFENDVPADAEGPDSADYLASPTAPPDRQLRPEESGGTPRTAGVFRSALGVPSSKKARLINTMGSNFQNSIPTIRPWLINAGYDVNVQLDGSVEGLRNLNGDGLIYFSGHGLPGKGSAAHMALWTTTPMTKDTVALYRPEVKAGLLAYGDGYTDRLPPPFPGGVPLVVKENRIVITEKFVEKYWRPAPGALLYMDACVSNDARLKNVCLGDQVKASAYIGWTDVTFDDMSTASVRFFFDRALGANSYGPFRTPPQRPFDGQSIMTAMAQLKRKNGFPFDTSVKALAFGVASPIHPVAKLVLSLRAGETSPVLRPGIASARIAEITSNGWLELVGSFGNTPGTVTLGGQQLTVQSGGWEPTRIRCNRPPDSGTGATGDLVVTVNGHASNPRRITGWDVTCNVHWQEFGPPCDACQWDATWRGLLRADADQVRPGPEQAPRRGVQTSSATAGQQLTFDSASGAYRIRLDISYDITWSLGSAANTPAIGVCLGWLPTERYKGLCFELDGINRRITLQPTWLTTGVNALHVPVDGQTGTYTGNQPVFTAFSGNFASNGGVAALDDSYTLHGGEKPIGSLHTVLRWQSAAAINPPSAQTPK